MTESIDGGPAFPTPTKTLGGGVGCPEIETVVIGLPGMSLRDWFAGQAIQGMAHVVRKNPGDDHMADSIALSAYEMADAMLVERAKATEKGGK